MFLGSYYRFGPMKPIFDCRVPKQLSYGLLRATCQFYVFPFLPFFFVKIFSLPQRGLYVNNPTIRKTTLYSLSVTYGG